MKSKILFIILCFSVVLFSCKKEKSPEAKLADVKKQVIGTWATQSSSSVTYYDAAGKTVKTEPSDIDEDIKIQFVNATILKSSESPDDSHQYTLTNVNGKIMLNVINVSYELKVNSNTMSWDLESEYSDDNDEHIVKSITTIQFKKL